MPRVTCPITTIYAVGETVTGEWIGRGAELLGLTGAVKMEDFDAIRQGVGTFSTGEYLRPRQNVDRFNKEGEKIATARNSYDFTVSARKLFGASTRRSTLDRSSLKRRSAKWRRKWNA